MKALVIPGKCRWCQKGALAWLVDTQLCPIIWVLVLALVALLVYKVHPRLGPICLLSRQSRGETSCFTWEYHVPTSLVVMAFSCYLHAPGQKFPLPVMVLVVGQQVSTPPPCKSRIPWNARNLVNVRVARACCPAVQETDARTMIVAHLLIKLLPRKC